VCFDAWRHQWSAGHLNRHRSIHWDRLFAVVYPRIIELMGSRTSGSSIRDCSSHRTPSRCSRENRQMSESLTFSSRRPRHFKCQPDMCAEPLSSRIFMTSKRRRRTSMDYGGAS
jgi:hypothetical protein